MSQFKVILESYKSTWLNLSLDQKVSLSILLVLLVSLPVGIFLSLKPTGFLSWASIPSTPPTTMPITSTPTITLPPTPTGTLPTVTLTPTFSLTPTGLLSTSTPTISLTPPPPTPTLSPPPGNIAPKITTSRFKSGSIGKYLERYIQAEDRNGDLLTLSVANLPAGLIFGDCTLGGRGNGTSTINCIVKGTPIQAGVFASEFLAKDIWGTETHKTIFFTILP